MSAQLNSLDSILDQQLDDLEDLPEFKPFPTGTHRFTISFESKEVNKHPSVELKIVGIETVELANPEDTPLTAGDSTNVLFMLDNEFGVGKLKAVLKPLSEHFGTKGVRDTMEAAKGCECLGVTKVRTNKDKTQAYTDVVNLQVL